MTEAASPRSTNADNASIDEGKERLKGLWQRGPVPLLIVGAVLIAAMVVLFLWANGPTYRVLFNNLDEADGGRVISELESRGIPFEIGSGGSAILVPSDEVYRLRLQLAEQGLPQSGETGFELMDQQRFGISQFAEQINYQRGLEGELARSIETVAPVAKARVHLSLAKPSVFVRDHEPGKASVVLTLHPGRSLNDRQVEAIRQLVSSAVPELSRDDVTVVDQQGKLLSNSADGAFADANKMGYQQSIEQKTRERILRILMPLYGEKNLQVEVTADIDFSKHEEVRERFAPNQDPSTAAVRSAQHSGALDAETLLASGIPGALSNTPPGWEPSPINEDEAQEGGPQNVATNNRDSDQQQYQSLINYEVDRTLSRIEHERGSIERITVATIINYRDDVDEEGNPIQVPLAAEEIDQVRALVRQAMGYVADRGDAIEVVNRPFMRQDTEESAPVNWWEKPEMQALILGIARYAAIVLLALIGYFALARPLIRHYTKPEVAPEAIGGVATLPKGSKTSEDGENTNDSQIQEDPSESPRKRRPIDYQGDFHEMCRIADEDPRIVAMIVRNWIKEASSS